MITYTYIVKCPECADEFFDFFDEAKEFALGCLSQKPVITQTEVNRNDFGECTDHCDLGTVWSWEDVMGKETDAEPAKSIFTKDDLRQYIDAEDPEFVDDDADFQLITEELLESRKISFKNKENYDEFIKLCSEIGIITGADLDRFMTEHDVNDGNLLDKLREYRAELGDNFKVKESIERKPIPEGMSIKELVEALEENEDTVECVGCEELFPKDECVHKDDIGWLCVDCEDNIVKCTWCEELYDKDQCRKEVDLGWLCSRCEAAIKSRGETLTFRENNYWDFLDEATDAAKTTTWVCYWNGVKIGTVEAIDEDDANYKMQQKYPEYPYGKHKHDDIYWVEPEDKLTEASLSDIAAAANSELGSFWNSEDLLDMAGVEDDFRHADTHTGMTPSEKAKYEREQAEEKAYKAKLARWKKYQKSKQEDLDPAELHDLGNTYDGGYPATKPNLPETDEISEVSDSHLTLCPECGKKSFDAETGICVDCGFN